MIGQSKTSPRCSLGQTASTFLVFIAFVCLGQLNQLRAQQISKATVYDSVQKIAAAVNENYFDIELASRVQQDLLANNEFDDVRSGDELAERLTARLMELTQDKHLVVSIRELEKPAVEVDRSKLVNEKQAAAGRVARRELMGKRSNFGIQKFEILPGNIAYLNFTSFFRDYEIAEILAAEMKMAANADAVILDMRFNMGGSTGALSLLSSYFFEGPERKLFDVVGRSGDTKRYSTDPTIGHRNEKRPVYVLVHPSTFSAGEGLAFIMQDQKRGTVIGETTAGAANPGRPYYANDLFEVNVPNGQVKAANSGKNWEGTGVTPDIDSEGKDALLIARRVALQKLIENETDESYQAELQNILDQLNKGGGGSEIDGPS